ncbi:MAG: hypothetical protein IJD28_07720 [Deferribacterales bacterium]|nr:hypothetical protein [Deferribacterales bacterium]
MRWINNLTEHKLYDAIKVYLLIYLVVMLAYCSVFRPVPTGEWDDYSLPSVSVMYDHNITISEYDIEKFKEVFPPWSDYIDLLYGMSGYKTDSGEIPWYFPVYSVAAIPAVIILDILNIPTIYAYTFTNLCFLMLMLFVVLRYLEISNLNKLLLILLLSINPVVFYLTWISAEVFIYSMIGISLCFWYNRQYNRGALFISVAGMLNPTVMVVGLVMIVDFFIYKYTGCKDKNIISFIKSQLKNIISFGSCFIISLIPMLYNLYYTGYINLTASYDNYTQSAETVFQRFIAYLLDLNFGFLPYFAPVFILGVTLLFIALYKRVWAYVLMFVAFLGTVFAYSFMVHINHGMGGIARYNAWSSAVMIFAVCLYYNRIIIKDIFKKIFNVVIIFSAVITSVIVVNYGVANAHRTSCIYMTPIAEFVLDNFPQFYNPLPSTFNSRIAHVDGGYWYDTPVVYESDKGDIKKILLSAKDSDEILNNYFSMDGDNSWRLSRLDNLTEEQSYITVPNDKVIRRFHEYWVGQYIDFYKKNYSGDKYVIKGVDGITENFSWTNGNILRLHLNIKNDIPILRFKGFIAETFNGPHKVNVYINDKLMHQGVIKGGQFIEFDFKRPDNGLTEIVFEMPEKLLSLHDLTGGNEYRKTALGINHVQILEAKNKEE